MAGLFLQHPFERKTIAAHATVYTTCLTIKALSTGPLIKVTGGRIGMSGEDGAAKQADFRIVLITLNSGTGTDVTPRKMNPSVSCPKIGTYRRAFQAEPTVTANTERYQNIVHPQGGEVLQLQFDDFFIQEGTEIALQLKIPAGAPTVEASGYLDVEE